ncbi:MAG: oligosaccharide flippase family protein [bacterium]
MVKKKIIVAVQFLHFKLFGHQMSDQMKQFLKNMSWSFYAGLIALPLIMIVGTLAGRFMGPEEFGKYSLVVLLSSYVLIFVFCGLDIALVKAIAKAKTVKDQSRQFFSAFSFVLLMLTVLSTLGLLSAGQISARFNISKELITLLFAYSLIASVKNVLDFAIRGTERFKDQAIAKILESVTLAVAFVAVVILLKKINYSIFLGIIMLAALALILFYLTKIAKMFKNFSFTALKIQLLEGRFFMLSTLLGTIFVSSDRLLIAKFINLETLGIYSAYYSGSVTLTAVLSSMLTNVLLPATAKSRDKTFASKMDKLFIKGFIPVFITIGLILVVFMFIFGRAYPLRADYVLLFTLVSTIYFFGNMYNTIILDIDRRNYIRYLVMINSINLLTVAYYLVLMKYYAKPINLILVGYAVNLSINFIFQKYFVKKMSEGRQ